MGNSTATSPRILHLSSGDGYGGAARAAYRVHRSLVDSGLESRMRVLQKTEADDTVSSVKWPSRIESLEARLKHRWERHLKKGWSTDNPNFHSLGLQGVQLSRLLDDTSAYIYHLHWVSGLVSIRDIARLNRPIVWTLHDMWAFCGAEHYSSEAADTRWRKGYLAENRPSSEFGRDLNRYCWENKRRAWRAPMTIVAPSRWMADCARDSVLFQNFPVHVIPYPLDLSLWRPIDQSTARASLGLPQEGRLILFGADGGLSNPVKGVTELRRALDLVSPNLPDGSALLVFGQHKPDMTDSGKEFPLPVHWLGRVRDDRVLVLAYSAADVMLVPSRQDNLPQTAVEPQCCGTPVVAFNIGGLPDIVLHEETGYLAPPFDVAAFAQGIRWVLADSDRHARLRAASRAHALKTFAPDRIAEQYRAVYEQVLFEQTVRQ